MTAQRVPRPSIHVIYQTSVEQVYYCRLHVLQRAQKNGLHTLSSYTIKAGPSAWPQSCPSGYSQHLFTVYDGCAIHYCVKANALSYMALPIIKRPPFQKLPHRVRYDSYNHADCCYIVEVVSACSTRYCITVVIYNM